MSNKQKPFPFQRRVAEHLLAGRDVILQAPTGAGKTRAGLGAWMMASASNEPQAFPMRCIYSVPMRVLANQFIEAYDESTKRFARLRGREDIRAAIQTGEQPDDPKFEQMLVFATLDQTLSSVLGIPYSLSPSQGNLNAGAVMSSYLVWDEFHLFGREQALPTTLHLLQMLKGITPFCLMTATFSQTLLDGLARLLGAEVVTVSAAEREAIPSQKGKERRFFVVDEGLTAGAVLENFNRRAIAICNTVARAQALCAELREQAPSGTEVRLLHSRFYQGDRQATTLWVHEEFGEGWQGRAEGAERAILVATQVIEVGMDITCEVLHSELAPANTLIQRAGRCARFRGERGEVRIYALPVDEGGKAQTAPYMGKEADLCARSWAAFGLRDGQVLDYEAELQILEEVHHEDDAALLEEIEKERYVHRQKMMQAMSGHDYQVARGLIRDIDNRSLVIHGSPRQDELLKRSPWAREALNIPRSTFFRLAKGRKEPRADEPRAWLSYEEEELDWALCYPVPEDKKEGDEQLRQGSGFDWKRVDKVGELEGQVLFAIHPSLVTYDAHLGLRLVASEEGIAEAPERERKGGRGETYSYELETYAEHISGLWQVCRGGFADGLLKYPPLLDEMAYSLPRLAARCGCTADELMHLLKVIIAGHDVGKLAAGWQNWVKRWQREKVKGAYDANVCYAHTDFDGSEAHKALQKEMPKRPPHAAESAVALIKVLIAVTKATKGNTRLLQAALTAITRHHTAMHSGALKLDWQAAPKVARVALGEALEKVGLEKGLMKGVLWREHQGNGVSKYLVGKRQNELEAVLAYLWLSRLLRMADQRSMTANL